MMTKSSTQSAEAGELFYLQEYDRSSSNTMLWWALGDRGYTTDITKAQTYTREQAQEYHDRQATSVPWPKAYIDARTRLTVDMQNCHPREALAGTGITRRC